MRRLLVAAAGLSTACTRPVPDQAPAVEAAKPEVRITQFYAEPVLARGEKATLCYGVENAKSVRLDPPVERVWPALTRCFPVSPSKATRYTLTAEDGEGKSVSQSVEIRIGPPLPKIIEVSVSQLAVKAGEEVTVCFRGANGVRVDIGPGQWRTPKSPAFGCVAHRPAATTTYRVQLTGAGGQTDSEKVTVTVQAPQPSSH